MKNKHNKVKEEIVRGSIDYELSRMTSRNVDFVLTGRKNKSKPIEGKKQLDINILFNCPCCEKGLTIHLRKDLT